MKVTLEPIGVVHTPHKTRENIPIQGGLFPDSRGTVEVYPKYAGGLSDVDGFSHLIILYLFHESSDFDLLQKPFLDDQKRGVFAIRSPRRPNPIGLTVVKLDSVEGNILHVLGVDMLDGTPLLDIKPYIPWFDSKQDARIGWAEGKIKGRHKSDGRFS